MMEPEIRAEEPHTTVVLTREQALDILKEERDWEQRFADRYTNHPEDWKNDSAVGDDDARRLACVKSWTEKAEALRMAVAAFEKLRVQEMAIEAFKTIVRELQ